MDAKGKCSFNLVKFHFWFGKKASSWRALQTFLIVLCAMETFYLVIEATEGHIRKFVCFIYLMREDCMLQSFLCGIPKLSIHVCIIGRLV